MYTPIDSLSLGLEPENFTDWKCCGTYIKEGTATYTVFTPDDHEDLPFFIHLFKGHGFQVSGKSSGTLVIREEGIRIFNSLDTEIFIVISTPAITTAIHVTSDGTVTRCYIPL